MGRGSVDANVVVYTSAIRACSRADEWEWALSLLAEMPLRDLAPNAVSYGAAIRGCRATRRWDLAVQLLREAREAGVGLDLMLFVEVVSACGKSRRWEQALDLLEGARREALRPDVALCNAVISACEKGRQWAAAVALVEEVEAGLEPEATTYNAAIAACTACTQWPWALELLGRMEPRGLSSDGIALGSVASGLVRAGLHRRGLDMLEAARERWAEGGPDAEEPLTSTASLPVLGEGRGVVAVLKAPGVTTESVIERLRSSLFHQGRAAEVTSISRLDAPTSGVLVAALGPATSAPARWLMAQFSARLVSKEYLCLCSGPPLGPPGSSGELSGALEIVDRREGGAAERVVVSPVGRPALTQYRLMGTFAAPGATATAAATAVLSLLAVRLVTGRMHQIRAHLAALGRPLAGDLALTRTLLAPDFDAGSCYVIISGQTSAASRLHSRLTFLLLRAWRPTGPAP